MEKINETPADAPERLILTNSPALHALKRPQLLGLCKQFGLKGSGKNTDLLARLQAYGSEIASEHEVDDGGDSVMEELANSTNPLRNSSIHGDYEHAVPCTPSKDHSRSSMVSTIKSAGRSIIQSVQRALESPSSASRFMGSAPTDGVEYSGQPIPCIYPSLAHLSPSPSKQPVVKRVSSIGSLRLSNDLAIGTSQTNQVDVHKTFVNCLQDEGSASQSTENDTIVPKGTTHIGKLASSLISPKSNQMLPFVFGSPEGSKASGDGHPGSFTFQASMYALSFASPEVKTTAGGKSASERVMEEMNSRTLQKLGGSLSSSASQSFAMSVSGASNLSGDQVFASNAKNIKTCDSFDGKHKKVFDKMDSISTHYAAKRTASSSDIASGLQRSASTRSISGRVEDEARDSKRLKLTKSVSTGASLNASGSTNVAPKSRNSGDDQMGSSSLKSDFAPKTDSKRKLDFVRARRQSGIKTSKLTSLSGNRKSSAIGRVPQRLENNKASTSSFMKSTVKRFSVDMRKDIPAAKETVVAGPKLAFGSSHTSKPSTSQAPLLGHRNKADQSLQRTQQQPTKGPGWKKFDLQASLARPLPYIPKIGAQYRSASQPHASNIACPDVPKTVASNNSGKQSVAAKSAATKPRVANRDLLSAVRPSNVSAVAPSGSVINSIKVDYTNNPISRRTSSRNLKHAAAAVADENINPIQSNVDDCALTRSESRPSTLTKPEVRVMERRESSMVELTKALLTLKQEQSSGSSPIKSSPLRDRRNQPIERKSTLSSTTTMTKLAGEVKDTMESVALIQSPLGKREREKGDCGSAKSSVRSSKVLNEDDVTAAMQAGETMTTTRIMKKRKTKPSA